MQFTWTATNACGQTSTSATITAVDTTGPMFSTLPQSKFVIDDGKGNFFTYRQW